IRKSKNLPPLKYNYPENFVEQLAEFIPHLSVATFIGGEPMLIKSYYKIWEAIIKINPRCTIHIQTNGSILTEKFLELIDSGQFEIGVSIDAPTKATFEMIRLRADFDEVEKNILILREYAKQGKIYMNFNFCPLTINWKEIPEMIEYANKMDITLKLVNVQYPAHLALQHRDSAYLTKVYEELSNYRFSASGSSVISKMNGRTFDHFLKNVSYYKEESLKWESFLSEHIPQSLDNITRILYDQVYSIKNFETFATAEKDKIFQEMCGYIYSKSNDEAVLRNIFMRIIYSFKLTEHEGDNNMSGNLEAGFSIFKRIADGFYDLENELKEAECKIA
ncbi:MAG: radical domain protein, partial [Bacteroidota bacterium]|nr:radical domain protein [Bacteroidota bacterium]